MTSLNKALKIGLISSVCALAFAGTAFAQARAFDVPAGDLKTALDGYIRQSGAQLIYRSEDLTGLTSPGVHGTLSTDEALSRLLVGSRLAARKDSSGAIAIVRVANPQGQPANAPAPVDTTTAAPDKSPPTGTDQKAATGAQGKTDNPPQTTIVVTGQRPPAKSSIDRRTYNVGNDPIATTGSASDILRNVPSVEVDAQGNISLRGDSSVQVLIDGKPSSAMSGASRATALQQMPANTVDSVEVMTNPSAQFSPEGSGGVINIITKKNRKPGVSGTFQASMGSEGRYNLGLGWGYNPGQYNLHGNLNLRQDHPKAFVIEDRGQIDPATHKPVTSSQNLVDENRMLSPSASIGIDYNFNPNDTASAEFDYESHPGIPQLTEDDLTRDSNGNVLADETRVITGKDSFSVTQASAQFRHNFGEKGHDLSFDFRRGEYLISQNRLYNNTFRVPTVAPTIDEFRPQADIVQVVASANYSLPLPNDAKFQAGYMFQREDDDFQYYGGTIVAGISIANPFLTNHFIFGQTVRSVYGTYQWTLAKKWTALAGLRLEQVDITAHQMTSGEVDQSDYFRVYPTLHLQYDLSDAQKLRFSYGQRINRPPGAAFNPYVDYQDAFNLASGNPDLKPQQIATLEAGYYYNRGVTSFLANFYYVKSRDGLVQVSRAISPTILLTTQENIGRGDVAGMEFAANGKFSKALSYNISGKFFRTSIDGTPFGGLDVASTSYSLKGGLDYQATPIDMLQLNLNFVGERLLPQGRRLPASLTNIGYRHKFNDRVTGVVTVTDLFRAQRDRTRIETADFSNFSERHPLGCTVFAGLTWQLGGSKPGKDNGFEYGAQLPSN